MSELAGQCHCGAIKVLLHPSAPPEEMPLRACQCSFCRRHGAMTTSTPESRLFIEAAPGALTRYRFGLTSADFLLCAECGVYVASVMETDGGLVSVLNVAGAAVPGFAGREPEPHDYDDETLEARVARRKARWMPASLVEATPSA